MPYDHEKFASEIAADQETTKKPWNNERFGFETVYDVPNCFIIKDPLKEIGPFFKPIFMEMEGSGAPKWLNIKRCALLGSKRTEKRLYGGDFFTQVEALIDPDTYLVLGLVSDGLSSGLDDNEQERIMSDIFDKVTPSRQSSKETYDVLEVLHTITSFTGCDTSTLDYIARTNFWSNKNPLVSKMIATAKEKYLKATAKYSDTDQEALQMAFSNISQDFLQDVIKTQAKYLNTIRTTIFSHLGTEIPIPWADSIQTLNINLINRRLLDEKGDGIQISATLAQSMADTVIGAEWQGESTMGRLALTTDHNLPIEQVFSGMCKEFNINREQARKYYLEHIYPIKVGNVYASAVRPNVGQPARVMAQYDREQLSVNLTKPEHYFTTTESTDGGIYISRDLTRNRVNEDTFFNAVNSVLDNENARAELTRNPSDDFCVLRNNIAPR